MFEFHTTADDPQTAARTGVFETPHGWLLTPVFAPVGTHATVKTLTPRDLAEIGATLVLANTYHLHLCPGTKLVADCGGLHSFMGWPGPMLTDSGGFQVFSLAQMRQLNPDGVTFRSHIDGTASIGSRPRAPSPARKTWARISSCASMVARRRWTGSTTRRRWPATAAC